MVDVFISYSRKDKSFVQRLHNSLAGIGRDTWIDWEDIAPTANWLKEIYAGIEAADNFVFIISPDSAKSEICRQEIDYALTHNKRFVPVLYRDLVTPDERAAAHNAISTHNWIFFRDGDDYNKAFSTLINAIDTDLVHVKTHTRLLVRAREWDVKGRGNSFVLRGAELQEGEAWLGSSAGKIPQPIPLQTEYLFASRRAANRRQQTILGGVLVALVISLILAALALYQSQIAEVRRVEADEQRAIAVDNAAIATAAQGVAENNAATAIAAESTAVFERDRADEQFRIALSRQLSSQAINLLDERPDIALLLSMEAYRYFNSPEARDGLLTSLQYNPALLTQRRNHESPVTAMTISPDGTKLASGDKNGLIVVWDLKNDDLNGSRYVGHFASISALHFSDDGQTLISTDAFGELARWDVTTPSSRINLDQHIATYNPLFMGLEGDSDLPLFQRGFRAVGITAISPDGRSIALGGQDNDLYFYDSENGQALGDPITGYGYLVNQIVFSPDGKYLAINTLDAAESEIRNLADGTVHKIPIERAHFAFSPDSRVLAVANYTGFGIWLFDPESGEPLREINSEELSRRSITDSINYIGAMAYSPDGSTIAFGDENADLWLADVNSGEINPQPLKGHITSIQALAFSADGQRLYSASADGLILSWRTSLDTGIGQPLSNQYRDHFNGALAVSPDNKLLAFSIENEGSYPIVLWDREADAPLGNPLEGHTANLWSLEFSPDGTRLASSDSEGYIRVWDINTRERIAEFFAGEGATVIELDFNTDGSILASADGEIGTVSLWDMQTLQRLGDPLTVDVRDTPVEINGVVSSVAFSPDGKYLAAPGLGVIVLWEIDDKTTPPQRVNEILTESPIWMLTFSPDGSILAGGQLDTNISLWRNYLSPNPVQEVFVGHDATIQYLAFTPDGQTLASASGNDSVILWDILVGQPIGQQLYTGSDFVNTLVFADDGQTLYSATSEGVVLWRLGESSLLSLACYRANLNFTPEQWKQFFAGLPFHVPCPESAGGLWQTAEQAAQIAADGDRERAQDIFVKAIEWAAQANEYGDVCLQGALSGFAELILPTCDSAVAAAPVVGGSPRAYRGRAIARALNGDFAGAADDL